MAVGGHQQTCMRCLEQRREMPPRFNSNYLPVIVELRLSFIFFFMCLNVYKCFPLACIYFANRELVKDNLRKHLHEEVEISAALLQ